MPTRRLVALTLAFAFALPGAAHAQGIVLGQSKIRHNGIGKVFTGMTIKAAREAAGIPLTRSEVGDCVYLSATPGSPDGPTLRFHGGKLRHVTVGRDLVFETGRHRLIFSVAQGRVYRISGGRAPWVLQQECV